MEVSGTPRPPAEPLDRLIVTLVDLNDRMVRAWRQSFEQNPEVHIVHGSMLDQRVDAWVTPTNARISMDGGLDAAIKNHLGSGIEAAAQQQMHEQFGPVLPVGCATCVPTGVEVPRYLVSTPTMHGSSEDVSATMNVALACVGALQAVRLHNRARSQTDIYTVALPGLGVGTGQVPPEIAADLMWTAYNLLKGTDHGDFAGARRALAEELGEIEPVGSVHTPVKATKPSQPTTGSAAPPPTASTVPPDEDFDDFD